MRCKTCGYRLWNLTEQRCPECGAAFLPSQFEFVPYSVQFRCPHCHQSYFGTDPKGHLVPAEFDCVSCGRRLQMDQMLVLPAEGVPEDRTRAPKVPWLERRERGVIKSWAATVGMAMVSPMRMMRILPATSPAGEGWWFAGFTTFLILTAAFTPFAVLFGIMVLATGSTGLGLGGCCAMGGIAVGALLATLLLISLWGAVAHGLLRLTGRTAGRIGRTYHAICYSSGANVVSAIPCVGPYVGWIWWAVSAVLMLKTAQQVGAARAALAVLLLPVLAVATVIGLYVWLMVSALATIGTSPWGNPTQETQVVAKAILSYAAQNGGRGPDHAIQLVTGDYLTGSSLVSPATATREDQVPVGKARLDQFLTLAPDQAEAAAQEAIQALPDGVIAHRLGDFVFTYHGLDLSAPDSRLWIVIRSPDPITNAWQAQPPSVQVGLADGTVQEIPAQAWAEKLAAQNAVRAELGLPPLPDPANVLHRRAALGEP